MPSNQAPVFRLTILIDLGLQLPQYPASWRCFGVSALPSPFFAIELHYPRGPRPRTARSMVWAVWPSLFLAYNTPQLILYHSPPVSPRYADTLSLLLHGSIPTRLQVMRIPCLPPSQHACNPLTGRRIHRREIHRLR